MISAILDQRTRCFYSAVPKLISLKNNISFQYEYIKRGETVLAKETNNVVVLECWSGGLESMFTQCQYSDFQQSYITFKVI